MRSSAAEHRFAASPASLTPYSLRVAIRAFSHSVTSQQTRDKGATPHGTSRASIPRRVELIIRPRKFLALVSGGALALRLPGSVMKSVAEGPAPPVR